ncbi:MULTISPECIES: CDP-alcohol phosphatidyltransferase family protein [Microbacterium]|uniref:CDP-alcohol phosphatidyltransferase family protein n=1 Tax=Microbacterium TaxID=33882 RepID=UPI00217EC9D3|nr:MULTISPECIES: CDP-alcohol phosphatidyltransferase family protein [Microbacterium]UWF77600.1 CDP-alcohol phosphatidyltransferase family protein [Microbacterium neungamense]WCM55771.1 CDP-alcohol phosphatidyltransferase family protein [Microbacterium sp. EF45047]
MDTAQPRPRPHWATIPNAITLLRLLLIAPAFVLIVRGELPGLALALLALFGTTDWVDGFLARRLGQTSAFGALFDPVADRLGVGALVLALVIGGHLPAWVVLVIAGVDVTLLIVSVATRLRVTPASSRLGKLRTAILMVGLVLVGVGLLPALDAVGTVGLVVTSVGAVLHMVTGIGYFREMVTGGREAA